MDIAPKHAQFLIIIFSGGFTHERQDRCIKRKMNFDGNLDFSVLFRRDRSTMILHTGTAL